MNIKKLLSLMIKLGDLYFKNKAKLITINRKYGRYFGGRRGGRRWRQNNPDIQIENRIYRRVMRDLGRSLKLTKKQKANLNKKIRPKKSATVNIKSKRKEALEKLKKIFGRDVEYNWTCRRRLQYHFPIEDNMVICLEPKSPKQFKIYIHKRKGGYGSRIFGFTYAWAKERMKK